jgi:hypothetical protein
MSAEKRTSPPGPRFARAAAFPLQPDLSVDTGSSDGFVARASATAARPTFYGVRSCSSPIATVVSLSRTAATDIVLPHVIVERETP